MKSSPGLVDYGLLVLLSAIFGASFMLIGVAVKDVPSLTIVAIRLGLAAGIFLFVAWLRGGAWPARRLWVLLALSALLGNALPFFLITWGQEKIDAGLAAILISVMPLLTLTLAHFLTEDEKLNRYKLAGVFLGLAGITYLFGFDKLASIGDEALRQYAIFGAALCYALNVIVMKSLTRLPPYATLAVILLLSFVMVLPFALLIEAPWTLRPSGASLIALLALGIVSTAGGNLLRFEIVRRQGAGFISQINYLIPIFGIVWAFLVLAEMPSPRAYPALGLILAGVALARLGSVRRREVPAPHNNPGYDP